MGDLTLLQAIAQVGFPIAVATYTLVVLNKTVQQNTEIMKQIAVKFDIMCKTEDK